ncbi:hypothetical protein [Sinomicrobium soli]|uniref:hypothetical protein n=1 Tax=Sinomicrobium sp. N-1-3-6 TaxID=2219864 RepID=UPI000DCD2D70|nr:hypothetical protein [Sinomicrobium sp. N-1-3-6]RAV29187.1 hypothetical protein DN748_09720 [Sinomicrobium sp. N-1-3-6]
MEYTNLDKRLQLVIEQAEELAIESIQSGSEFSPYIFYDEKKIKRIVSNNLEEAIDIAEDEIENMNSKTVVLVFHDIVKLNDGSFKAIISQLYDEDEDSGYSYGLLYKIENSRIKFLNKRVFLGEVRNCLIF